MGSSSFGHIRPDIKLIFFFFFVFIMFLFAMLDG